jgi:hypothetical protein
MSWSFCLFVIAFIISISVRTTLMWAMHLPPLQKTFATSFYWDSIISLSLSAAFMSGSAAIFVLKITVLRLASAMVGGPDSLPTSDVSSETPATLTPASLVPHSALAISVLALALLVGAALMVGSWWANGFAIRRKITTGSQSEPEDIFI